MSESKKFKLSNQEIEKLCRAGGLAPSGGNAQPWKVVVEGNTLTISVNTRRLAGFLDIGKYASFFALGCFMENLCIEADALGLVYKSEMSEIKGNTDVIIKILFTGKAGLPENNKLAELEPYLTKRATNRRLYDGTIIDKNNINQLKSIVSAYKPSIFDLLTVVTPEEKTEVAKILGEIDGIRMMHDVPFKDMMSEIRWSDDEARKTKDGLDIKTLELPANMDKMLRLLNKMSYMRRFMPATAFEGMAKPVLLNCSHLCCLFMSLELSPSKMVLAGRLVERLWLTATKLGISFQPWTVFPFFIIRANYFKGKDFSEQQKEIVKQAEGRFLRAFGVSDSGVLPVFIFRLSLSKPPSARALRIPWQEFTEIKN